MTREDTKKILVMLASTYPNFKIPDKEIALGIWHEVLEEYSLSSVLAALKIYLKTNTSGFAPVPAQLIEIMTRPTVKDMTSAEAWAMVRKALANGTYGAEEEFKKFPEEVKRAVGSPEQLHVWATDSEFNESVVSSHFIRAYNTTVERTKKDALVAGPVMEALMQIARGEKDVNRLQGSGCEVSLLPVHE